MCGYLQGCDNLETNNPGARWRNRTILYITSYTHTLSNSETSTCTTGNATYFNYLFVYITCVYYKFLIVLLIGFARWQKMYNSLLA